MTEIVQVHDRLWRLGSRVALAAALTETRNAKEQRVRLSCSPKYQECLH